MEPLVVILSILAVLVLGGVGFVVAQRTKRRELPPPPTKKTTPTLPPRVEKAPPAAPPVKKAAPPAAPPVKKAAPVAPPVQKAAPPVAPPVGKAPPVSPPVEAPAPVEVPALVEAPAEPAVETPAPTAGRLVRLRARLARSQNIFGKGLLAVLSRDKLDDDAWDEVEESLIGADVGVKATTDLVATLRERTRVLGTATTKELRALLAEELTAVLDPSLDRSLKASPVDGKPAVILIVGVNGAGKTTTCGKIGRVLIADGHSVVFGAADTFRAAAAEQLTTWASRVGAEVVRGAEGGDPAAVAFDAVKKGIDSGVDTVLIDTAGRLQNKVGLMDELGKIKRVVEKHGPISETLLVLDATAGQNGLSQAKVFTEVANVTGVVLTKLDGTAKGGIVIAVQQALGIPVKLVGLGEGPDDMAPFDVHAFVNALLGDE